MRWSYGRFSDSPIFAFHIDLHMPPFGPSLNNPFPQKDAPTPIRHRVQFIASKTSIRWSYCRFCDSPTNTTLAGAVDENLANQLAASLNPGSCSFVNIVRSDGICPLTNTTLRQIPLTGAEKEVISENLAQLAETQFLEFTRTGGGKKYSNKNKNNRNNSNNNKTYYNNNNNNNNNNAYNNTNPIDEIKKFKKWLLLSRNGPFTAIVDGANVAYYGQNYDGGFFNLYQINAIVEILVSRGENPLIILPHKYTTPSFGTNKCHGSQQRQVLSEDEKSLLREWTNSGQLYISPPRCLDDYYWIMASVADQSQSQSHPQSRPIVISNDEMRDHKLSLCSPRQFQRWKANQMVLFR